jgi:hypothetical protein
MEVVPAGPGDAMTIRIWNEWRDSGGTMQAWIGDAGLVVEALDPNHFVLRCSDGFPPQSFTDLVIDVVVEPLHQSG